MEQLRTDLSAILNECPKMQFPYHLLPNDIKKAYIALSELPPMGAIRREINYDAWIGGWRRIK